MSIELGIYMEVFFWRGTNKSIHCTFYREHWVLCKDSTYREGTDQVASHCRQPLSPTAGSALYDRCL